MGLQRVASGECDSLRRATHTGEPLGSGEFVRGLEQQAGRRLQSKPASKPFCLPGADETENASVPFIMEALS